MTRATGEKVAAEMRRRGTGPTLWAHSRGHHRRTVNQVLYHGLGQVRGGPKTDAVFADLIKEKFISKKHEFVEPVNAAS